MHPEFYKKKKQACKPGSVLRKIGVSVIYLVSPLLTKSSNLPPGIGRAALLRRYT